MAHKAHNIIVIGTSAGGLQALDTLIGGLPTDLPASLFIVQHMAVENTGEGLLLRLGRHRSFHCKLAENGEVFEPGKAYIAPPDNHLLVKSRTVLVTKGARENRYRPAIDPLFRSAAVTHGPRVIGVILTGMLDDGVAGLLAIQKCGGATVVQDPKDADYPEMPQNALDNLTPNHCVPLSEMGRLLEELTRRPVAKAKPIPKDLLIEARIAERVLSDVAQVDQLGTQKPYNCPNCGGVLWEIDNAPMLRYRCHTGHSFTAAALLDSQSEKAEETLWVALRMFEERKNLLNNMAEREAQPTQRRAHLQRAKDTVVHIDRIRAMLLASQSE